MKIRTRLFGSFFIVVSGSILLRISNVPGKIYREIKKHIFYVRELFFDSRAFFEIMWNHIVEPDKPEMTIWHMRIPC